MLSVYCQCVNKQLTDAVSSECNVVYQLVSVTTYKRYYAEMFKPRGQNFGLGLGPGLGLGLVTLVSALASGPFGFGLKLLASASNFNSI